MQINIPSLALSKLDIYQNTFPNPVTRPRRLVLSRENNADHYNNNGLGIDRKQLSYIYLE